MAETQKVLGQIAPGAVTEVDLYEAPASTKAVVSTITACNRSAVDTTFRVTVAVAGAALDVKQYLYYDLPLPANETFAATYGITLNEGDVVRVLSGNGSVSFSLFGVEIT